MIIFIGRSELTWILGASFGIRHETRKGITEEKEDLRKVKGGK